MPDQADASPEHSPAGSTRTCLACGAYVDATAWHPVATHVDEDGDFHLYTFCSTDCRTAWELERARPDGTR